MWNMPKINNLNSRTPSIRSLWCFYCYLWIYFTPFSIVYIVDFENVDVSLVKTIQMKKRYCQTTLGATDVLKNFTKITGKKLRQSLFLIKLQVYREFFTGDYLATCSNFLWYLVQQKKSSENIYISLKIYVT